MEKRIIVAFVLSFGVLLGYNWLFAPEPPAAPQPSEQSVPPPASAVPPAETSEPAALQNAPVTEETPQSVVKEVRGEKDEAIVVDTDLYTAELSNSGGLLRSFKLKNYMDADGNPIELINLDDAGKVGWPLAIVSGDGKTDEALGVATFAVTREGSLVRMEFASDGLIAEKVFDFGTDTFEFSLESKLSRDGKSVPHDIVWQGRFGDQSIPVNGTLENVVYKGEEDFERVNIGSLERTEVNTTRAGVEDQYFMAMLLPSGSSPTRIDKEEYPGSDGEAVTTPYVAVRASESGPTRIYVGPKDQRWLQLTDPELTGVVDYGFFEVITRPLILALLWIHSYIGNFGWAIILLTIFINLALFPLRLKQQISMQKMQKIQPQMRTLQDKYKKLKANDPKRAQVQSEMMGLYREHGVNPMGGCLPLLLQMPFFFAFWNMLSVSIEMRQAPWLLWIRDLSQHDPYYILPVLMAVTMFLMQRMMPTTADPAQAKVMMFMPLMFTFFFLRSSSGLVLYWLTSNVVGIGQQAFINKYWAPRTEARERSGKKGPGPNKSNA